MTRTPIHTLPKMLRSLACEGWSKTWEQIGNKTRQISPLSAIRAKAKGKTSRSLRD